MKWGVLSEKWGEKRSWDPSSGRKQREAPLLLRRAERPGRGWWSRIEPVSLCPRLSEETLCVLQPILHPGFFFFLKKKTPSSSVFGKCDVQQRSGARPSPRHQLQCASPGVCQCHQPPLPSAALYHHVWHSVTPATSNTVLLHCWPQQKYCGIGGISDWFSLQCRETACLGCSGTCCLNFYLSKLCTYVHVHFCIHTIHYSNFWYGILTRLELGAITSNLCPLCADRWSFTWKH